MHEKKNESSHNHFFQTMKKLIQDLENEKENAFFITDNEDAFRNAIMTNFPKAKVLRCWNHLFNNIRFWLKNHAGWQLDAKVYCNDCRDLFKCATKEVYTTMLNLKQGYWDQAFANYYLTYIHPDIDLIAKWTLESLDCFHTLELPPILARATTIY